MDAAARTLYEQAHVCFESGNYHKSRKLAEKFLLIAKKQNQDWDVLEALQLLAAICDVSHDVSGSSADNSVECFRNLIIFFLL